MYCVFILYLHFRLLQTTNERSQPPIEAIVFVPLSTPSVDLVTPLVEAPSPIAKASSTIVKDMTYLEEVIVDPRKPIIVAELAVEQNIMLMTRTQMAPKLSTEDQIPAEGSSKELGPHVIGHSLKSCNE